MENPIIDISSDVELFDTATSAKEQEKNYDLGDGLKITTATPVIVSDKPISPDEFSYADGVVGPLTQEESKKQGEAILSGKQATSGGTYADYVASQPTTQAQVNAAKKDGKFWDNATKSWKKFKDSPGGQFALQQTLSYLQQRLANGQNQTTLPPPPPEVQEKDNTVWYILGAVAVIGILAFVLTRDKKPAIA